MLEKDTARSLYPLANDPKISEALEVYMNFRVKELFIKLSIEADGDEVRRLQGAIREIQRFKSLREEVNGVLDARS